jgi:hypothetical protein
MTGGVTSVLVTVQMDFASAEMADASSSGIPA